MRQTTIFDDTFANRIEQILQRCDRLKRGGECSMPVVFDAD